MTAASKRNGHKRKGIRTARAKGQHAPTPKARSVAARPLNASHELTRTQVARSNRRQGRQQQPASGTTASLDVMGLMNRRAQAYFELPSRIACCHSPFEVWREQARFMQESFADYARHVTTFLRGAREKTSGVLHD